jgi:tRNA(adenine34) deaminase
MSDDARDMPAAVSVDADVRFMRRALELAREAAKLGEVPVGAVVVHDGSIVGEGMNRREVDADPLAHAEIAAIAHASRTLKRWRLSGCTLVVTLEPCFMCAGALVNARIDRLVYGALDPKAGAVSSLANVCDDARLNHRLGVTAGVLGDECGAVLREFFASLRQRGPSQ